ncbi:hypothetical protein ISS30_06840 [bacterium]|nr:hypothetical protein [bacterium]
MKRSSFDSPGLQFLIALAVYYILIILFFNSIIFAPNSVKLSPDYLGALSVERAGKLVTDQESTLWTPYFFAGMPLQASLQIPIHTYTGFNTGIVKGIISLIFLRAGMDYSVALMLFHLIMAGAFTYLLARSLGFHWITALICGVIYMFTPSLIALTNVGHGSKLFSSAYIPLVFLTVKQMLEKRNLLYFSLCSIAIGMTLLSLHVQVGFYALLAAGMYLVWSMIFDIRTKPGLIPAKALLFLGAVILGVMFASSLYFPLYEYSPYSIRGGAEEGLAWDYATSWSFHPLESLTYVIPSFFGFGGETYWGYMPFTDMPLYWGLTAFIFAVIAAVFVRNRIVTFFIILLLFAWIVSFGKFFPILYKPMFQFMPFFNRFRVPVMIQILMLFSVSVLFGYGLEKIRELAGKSKDYRWILYSGGAVIGIAILFTLFTSPLTKAFAGWIAHNRPGIPVQNLNQMSGMLFQLAFGDLWKAALTALAILGLIYFYFKGRMKFTAFILILGLINIVDLWLVNQKLTGATPQTYITQYFQPTPAVKFLKQQEGLFRIYPLDNIRSQNWYGAFGLQSISGYMGTKMKRYQAAIDGIGLSNFSLLCMLNCKYILNNQPLNHPALNLVLDGEQKVYENTAVMPRAWIVNKVKFIPDEAERLKYMKSGFNPWAEAVVEEAVDIPPGEPGTAEITGYSPANITIKTDCQNPAFLILSETHYPPYWKASIDGESVKIYPADQLLRGVKIPAGVHTVEFKCSSWLHSLSQTIHAGTMIVLILMLLPAGVKELKYRMKNVK